MSRQVPRGTPCTLPYGSSAIGSPGPGGAPARGAKLTASGAGDHGSPARSAASRSARVFGVRA
ncbi:hypothetical protein ACH4GK_15810 [Streptomyces rimosus]|uniref:hypothetical protein n=1 Tax=Streptomyces rimosus TaxID=1927 RepID=UPI0018FF02DD|nr:hypothetical protein [Streptomyces rimosus]